MSRPCSIFTPFVAVICASFLAATAQAEEPLTLIGTIVKWRYPDAEIGKSEMSDGATMDADGKRTVPSTLLKTMMVTPDSAERVIAFYRGLLTRNPTGNRQLSIAPKVGQSVVFSDESDGRPFALHTILVNTASSSTTIVITRGKDEQATRISWKQYLRPSLETPKQTNAPNQESTTKDSEVN